MEEYIGEKVISLEEKLSMKENSRTMTTNIVLSDDGQHRYLFSRSWGDHSKPFLTIITLNPGKADGVWEDQTTHIITNCVYQLEEYSGFHAVNLFSGINITASKNAPLNTLYDEDTNKYILTATKNCEKIVLAIGTGVSSNPIAEARRKSVLELLHPYKKKLFVLVNGSGKSGLHPLRFRKDWMFTPLEKSETKKTSKKIPENQIKTTIELNTKSIS